jgi:hypothetical protein
MCSDSVKQEELHAAKLAVQLCGSLGIVRISLLLEQLEQI